MKGRRKRLVGVGAFVIAGLAIWGGWELFHETEPTYQDKTLSAWAQQYGSNNWGANRSAAKEAQLAIRGMGTNCIPFLLGQMQARDTMVKRRLRNLLPQPWHRPLHLRDLSPEHRRIGAHGLAALGSNAPAAVPALIEIATNHPDDDGRYMAVFALRTLESAAEPAIPTLGVSMRVRRAIDIPNAFGAGNGLRVGNVGNPRAEAEPAVPLPSCGVECAGRGPAASRVRIRIGVRGVLVGRGRERRVPRETRAAVGGAGDGWERVSRQVLSRAPARLGVWRGVSQESILSWVREIHFVFSSRLVRRGALNSGKAREFTIALKD